MNITGLQKVQISIQQVAQRKEANRKDVSRSLFCVARTTGQQGLKSRLLPLLPVTLIHFIRSVREAKFNVLNRRGLDLCQRLLFL